jgi:hypothetical protein
MDENDLVTALEERADDVTPGPAPVDRMTRDASATRRRRGLVVGGLATAAVVAVAAVGVAVLPGGDDGRGRDDAPIAGDPAGADVPPEGFTYVGMGVAAVAVPDDWPRNDVECNGVPRGGSTVIADAGGVVCMMYTPFPADADAVTVTYVDTAPPEVASWTEVEVDGVEALRSPTGTVEPDPGLGGEPVTEASVYLPEQDVLFRVQSTVAPERVDELLDGIVVLEEHVGVPGFADLGLDGPRQGRADEAYLERLEEAGLEVELVEQTDRMARTPGEVISVTPEPGTIVAPGSSVEVVYAP